MVEECNPTAASDESVQEMNWRSELDPVIDAVQSCTHKVQRRNQRGGGRVAATASGAFKEGRGPRM